MKKNLIFFILSIFSVTESCAQSLLVRADSVRYIGNYFLVHDVYNNSFYCTERDIEELVGDHPDWVKRYFPSILKKYDLILFTQFQIAIELYKTNDESYLRNLWKKHNNLREAPEFYPIIKELHNHSIFLTE